MIDEFNGSGFAATDLRGRAPALSLIARLRQEMRGTGKNPQAGIPSHARSWFVGIVGELEIAGLLDALPSGWLVLHSVPLGESGTDIDHVVVSTRGLVITINTKRHAGQRIWVGEHALHVDGRPTSYLPKARAEAERAAARLSRGAGRFVTVRPFLVFVGTQPLSMKQQPAGVTVATPDNLVRFLRAAGSEQTSEDGPAVKRAAAVSTTWSSGRLDPSKSGELLNWFLSVREAVSPHAGVPRPGAMGSHSMSRPDGVYRPPSRARKAPHPLKVIGIVLGSDFGSLWALGMILGLLAAAAHGG